MNVKDSQQGIPVAIALGSNLGDSLAILEATVVQLSQSPTLELQSQSHWYQTLAVGPTQPDYLNGCIQITTQSDPEPLLQQLLILETQFGRVRQERWGPRTLDLDILLFGNDVIHTPTLTIPHPHLHERAFVLAPLAEICPHWIHPIHHQSIADLAKAMDYTGVRKLPSSPV